MGDANLDDSVIDLTDFDDNTNPLAEPVQVPKRAKKRVKRSNNNDGDSDLEITSCVTREKPPKRHKQQRTHLWENDGLEVVSETKLTPQEKLKRIQEQHAQGKAVELRPGTRVGTNRPMPSFGQFSFLGPGMFNQHPFLLPPLHNHLPPGILPGFLRSGGRQAEESLEHNIIQRTLNISMDERSSRKQVNVEKIIKPKDPEPARPGFTRSLQTDDDLVCIMCDHNLGEAKNSATETGKRISQRVFVRGCGHVYCGQCTLNMNLLPKNKSYCPIATCRKVVSAKRRNKFREVFI